MSFFKLLDVAGSALNAQSLRLNTVSSNLANAESVSSSVDQTYRARQPVFAALVDQFRGDQTAVGVRVKGIVESQAPVKMEYMPEHPMADGQGYIYKPNVNVVEEMANMLSASRSYQNNIEVMNTAKQLMAKTLQLGK